jgi:uroporphyrinogen-III synthase
LQGLLTPAGDDLLPLKGKTIVITRSVEQSKESAEQFRKLGADVVIFPTLDIVPPESWEEFDKIILNDNQPDYLILTSAHAVRMFKFRLDQLNTKPDYNNLKVVAIGNKTAAACERNNIPVDIIPSKFSSEGVIEELHKIGLEGKKVFIPRSAIGREELPDGLEKLGASILTAPVYNIAVPSPEDLKEYIAILNSSDVDLFVFTSPSTFDNFLNIMSIREPSDYFSGFKVAAIGPTTRTHLISNGVQVSVMPEEYNIDGLIKAVINFYKNNDEERSTN